MKKNKILWLVLGGGLVLVLALAPFFINRARIDGTLALEIKNPQSLQMTRSRILVEEEEGIFLVDKAGEKALFLEKGRYDYASSADRIYVLQDQELAIYDDQGRDLEKISLDKSYDRVLAQEKAVILISDHEQVCYSDQGELLESYEEDQALMVLGASSSTNKYQAFSSLRSTKNRYASILSVYQDQDLFFQQELVDQIILSLDYVEDKLFVLTQKMAYIFEGASVRAQIPFDQLTASALTKDKLFVIDREELLVFDFDGKRLDKVPLARDYQGLLASSHDIVLYYDNAYASYSTNKITDFPVKDTIGQAIQVEGRIYLAYKNKIERIQ